MTNCPNCGAPLEPYKCKCEYCGTWYFDFTAFDMSEDEPYFVKFKTPYGIITTLAKPELRTIEVGNNYEDVVNAYGDIIQRFAVNKTCDLNVVFHSVTNPEDGTLYKVIKEDNENVSTRRPRK